MMALRVVACGLAMIMSAAVVSAQDVKPANAEASAGWKPAPQVAAADERVEWLKANAIAVRTIDPVDEDFADLEPLVASIGNARVVMLGEQTHGDGSCFRAKSRLCRFLHQRMGFDVLAFESGMFDLRWCEEAMRTGEPTSELHRRGLFGIWANSEQVRPLLVYVKESHHKERPLELAGFDSQFSSGHARDAFVPALIAFCDEADPELLTQEQREAAGEMSYWLQQREQSKADGEPLELIEKVRTIISTMESEEAKLERAHSPRDVAFMQRAVANMIAFTRQQAYFGDQKRMAQGGAVRDTAMGENLVWLSREYFAGRKIIVWAASMHNIKNAPKAGLKMDPDGYKDTVTMGNVAWKVLGEEIYSIMFTAYQGKAGMPWTQAWPVAPAPKGSLDALLHGTGLPYAFVDFRGLPGDHWLRERMTARPLGYADCDAVWPDQFDAVFHTDTMEKSTVARHEEK